MFRWPQISKLLWISLFALSACGKHSSVRLPDLASQKSDGKIERNTIQQMELMISLGNIEGVTALLDSGFPVDTKLSTDRTPLLEAICFDQDDLVALFILRGADPQISDHDGLNAFALAQHKRRILRMLEPQQALQLLREFFDAIKADDSRTVERILKDEGEDVNVEDLESGETPLTMTLIQKRAKVIRMLFNFKKMNVNKKNRGGRSPLSLAKETKWKQAEDALVKKGALED